MSINMMEKLRQLKEDWLYVKSKGEIHILTDDNEKKFFETVVAEEVKGKKFGLLSRMTCHARWLY